MIRARIPMPLATRFSITFSVLILVIFAGVALVVENHLTGSAREEADLRLAAYARSLAAISQQGLMSYDYFTLQQIAEDGTREPGITRVMIVDKEGVIGGCSDHRERIAQRVEDPIGLRGLIASEPFTVEGVGSDGTPCLDRIQPVFGADGTRWGTVHVGLSLRQVLVHARETRGLVLLITLVGTALCFGLSHLLARRITRPLGGLVAQATGLARGEWNLEPHVHTGDEIEKLAVEFNRAAEALGSRTRELTRARDELASLNATLEEKVRERTSQLEESREKYRLLVEASPDPLCLIQDGAFQFVNGAFLETFGYTEEQVLAPSFTLERLLHPDFVRVAVEVLAHAEATGEPIDTDWVAIGRGGRNLDFEVRGRQVTYRDHRALELLWIDLTERKRLLRQVVQNERLRAIGDMTAMIAHNFNNLLAVILGRTQLLLAKHPDGAMHKGLESVRTAAMQAGEIVKRIQEYSGETVPLQLREVNIVATLRDVVAYLDSLWQVTRSPGQAIVQVEVTAEEVPPVLGQEGQITEILKQVILNAAEAMPGGGTVRVDVRTVEDSVQIRVEDSGVGMTSEIRRRAFDPFFTTKGSGTRGLGLSTSYGIVQRLHGRIDLRSRDEGGTVAEIVLPVHRSAVSAGRAGSDSPVVFQTDEQQTARRLLMSLRDHSPKGESEEPGGRENSAHAA